MIGWSWDGTAPGAGGRGVSDDEDRAREAAEAWLRANPHGTAVLAMAHLTDGTAALSAYWTRVGRAQQSRLRDGRITWVPVRAQQSASTYPHVD